MRVILSLLAGFFWATCSASQEGLAADDECSQESSSDGCALSALQRRGSVRTVATCAKPGEDCSASQCCAEAGMTCYEKNQYYASCRPDCTPGIYEYDDPADATPWSCRNLDSSAATLESQSEAKNAPTCAGLGDDCTASKCCAEAGMECYEKNQWYAGCRSDCTPGIYKEDDPKHATAWSCKRLSTTPKLSATTPEPSVEEQPETSPKTSSREPVTNPIFIKGNFLYHADTQKRFFAKGIAYNPRNLNWNGVTEGPRANSTCVAGTPKYKTLEYTADVTADEHEEEFNQALKAITELGANTVRLYNIDPEKSHAKFMHRAAELGIYVMVPLTRMDWGFLPAFPSPDCYEKVLDDYGHVGVNLLTSAKTIVKEFSKYTNTLMFVVANELPVNDKNGFAAFPCVKALTRDIHRFQASCAEGMRRVPLLYADQDIGQPDRLTVAQYMTCAQQSAEDAVDAYGLNVYSWCDDHYLDNHGKPSFRYSPYQAIIDDFGHMEKPLLFTEFGCNVGKNFEALCPYENPKGRTWPDVPHMFREMDEVLSGAIAFEYSQEKNQFGIVLTPGFLEGQDELRKLASFYALQEKFTHNSVNPKWDGIDTSSCTAKPSDVAPLKKTHAASSCVGGAAAQRLQERHGVDRVVDWSDIPEPINSSTLAAYNASEVSCPAWHVPASEHKESCCHMNCSQ